MAGCQETWFSTPNRCLTLGHSPDCSWPHRGKRQEEGLGVWENPPKRCSGLQGGGAESEPLKARGRVTARDYTPPEAGAHRLYWGDTESTAEALTCTHRANVVGQHGGTGSLHQEGPPGCKERSSREAEGRAVPGGLAFPSGQWESKAGSARTLSTSQHRPELQVREDPAHTTANLPPQEPRLPHLLLHACLRSGGLPSPQPWPVGMALTLRLSVHLFPAPPPPRCSPAS